MSATSSKPSRTTTEWERAKNWRSSSCVIFSPPDDALNVCGLGPESLRELFDTLRVIGPSEVKAKMEILRDLGMQMDMQDRSRLN